MPRVANTWVSLIFPLEIKVSVIIPRKYCEVAVRTLHEEFCEHNPKTEEERR